MSSSLQDLKTALIAQLNDPAITVENVLLDRKELDRNKAAPKIVIVMMGGPIASTEVIGHGKIDPSTRAKIVRFRRVKYEFYCHGQDMDQAEQMLVNVVRSLHNLYLTGGEFGEESWLDQQEGEDGHVKHGSMVMFPYTLTFPVYNTQKTLTLLTADPPFDHDSEWGDNQESVGC